jgi:hypothetical protein
VRLLESRVNHARTVVLIALPLTTSSGVAGAAPALNTQRIHLDIGQTADLDAEVYFEVDACTRKPSCFVLHEFFDLIFNDSDECGEKPAPVPLAVAQCSFQVDGGSTLRPFEAQAGVFVAPASGWLSCGSPETLSARWDEPAQAWAEDHGYRCSGNIVPKPTHTGHINLAPRSQ